MIKLAEAVYLNACSFNSFEKLASNAARRKVTKALYNAAREKYVKEYSKIYQGLPLTHKKQHIGNLADFKLSGGYNPAHINFMGMATSELGPGEKAIAYANDYAQHISLSNRAKRFVDNRMGTSSMDTLNRAARLSNRAADKAYELERKIRSNAFKSPSYNYSSRMRDYGWMPRRENAPIIYKEEEVPKSFLTGLKNRLSSIF